ncbi:hypothetical protein KJ068_06400 [bacterium]|nr:hypothetical protein [bacterium]
MNDKQINKDLIKVAEDEGVVSLIAAALNKADAILTGVVGTEKLELLMIPGRLVQAARNNSFLLQLAQEFQTLVNKGKIKSDYGKTEQATSCFQELLAALEHPPVDETKFEALKTIFLKASTEELTSRDDPTPQLLMSIVKEMSSGEILLLAAVYKLGLGKLPTNATNSAQGWLQYISQNSVLSTTGMVEFFEAGLLEKKLLTDRRLPDRSGIDSRHHFRLTDLGIKLCSFFVQKD